MTPKQKRLRQYVPIPNIPKAAQIQRDTDRFLDLFFETSKMMRRQYERDGYHEELTQDSEGI